MMNKTMKRLKLLYLCAVLVFLAASLTGCAFGGIVTGEVYENAESYSSGNFTYSAADVQKVYVHWYSGAVELVQTDGERLSVSESGQNLSESEKLHYLLKDGQLNIQFWESGYSSAVRSAEKRLLVEIPQGISVSIVSVSATVSVGDLTAYDFEAISVSGDCAIGHLTCKSANLVSTSGCISADGITADENIKVGSVSGKIEIRGADMPVAQLNSTSGNIELTIEDCQAIDIGTTSGSVTIVLPERLGATVSYRATSGGITVAQAYEKRNGNYVIGDGTCAISVRSTSGNLRIR